MHNTAHGAFTIFSNATNLCLNVCMFRTNLGVPNVCEEVITGPKTSVINCNRNFLIFYEFQKI